MNRRQLIIFAILTVLGLVQVSLIPHFFSFSWLWLEWINLLDVAVAAIALLEKRSHKFSWLAAAVGGGFLDFYSRRFFGFWIIVLLAVVALIKFVVKKYVRLPSYW